MSFGWSAGDIFAAVKLLIEIGQALREATGSPKDHQRALSFVMPIINGLEQLLEYAREEEGRISASDKKTASAFRPTVEVLTPLIEQFTDKVFQYSGLQDEVKRKRDWFKRQFDKLQWHFVERDDLLQLRETIIAHFASLSAFYPKMIITILESQEFKSAERDADILDVANITAKGVDDIYKLLTHMWYLQQKSANTLLTLGPHEGVSPELALQKAGSELGSSDMASALLLIEPYIQPTMTDAFAAEASRMKVEGIIIRKLRTWLSDSSLSQLWFYGKKSTTLSAIVFDTARKRHRPIVAYPCRQITRTDKQMTEEKHLVGLVYSFLYQLLQQLPKGTDLEGWTSRKELLGLDGTLDSVSQVILFIESLLKNLPQCVGIIDGFQLLGHTQDIIISEHLNSLLRAFQAQGSVPSATGGRLLLTSSGPTKLLAELEGHLLDRFDVSQYVGSGRFILSTELMGVEW